jgi:hypothetical protein
MFLLTLSCETLNSINNLAVNWFHRRRQAELYKCLFSWVAFEAFISAKCTSFYWILFYTAVFFSYANPSEKIWSLESKPSIVKTSYVLKIIKLNWKLIEFCWFYSKEFIRTKVILSRKLKFFTWVGIGKKYSSLKSKVKFFFPMHAQMKNFSFQIDIRFVLMNRLE